MSDKKPFVGGLLMEPNRLPLCGITGPEFGWEAPRRQDNSTWLRRQTDDQGQNPWCASWSLGNIYESYCILAGYKAVTWPVEEVYKEAKRLDGKKYQDGTTLEYCFEAALNLTLFPASSKLREIPADPVLARWAIIRYGLIYSGYNITDAWMHPREDGSLMDSELHIGGHAVVTCTYSDIEGEGNLVPGVDIFNSWGKWGRTVPGDPTTYGLCRLSWEQWKKQFMYGLVIYSGEE